jgi:HSP20 family molecular chaperone IbpA
MSNIVIQRYKEAENTSFFGEVRSLFDEIGRRAYGLFERRGRANGGDLDDWLAAEREMLWSPPAELTETDDEFHVRVAAPGFDAKEVQVGALPGYIVVKAAASHEGDKKEGDLHFSQFAERTAFRRIDLPAPIDVDSVKATLDKGVMLLAAKKAAKLKEKNAAAAA